MVSEWLGGCDVRFRILCQLLNIRLLRAVGIMFQVNGIAHLIEKSFLVEESFRICLWVIIPYNILHKHIIRNYFAFNPQMGVLYGTESWSLIRNAFPYNY